MLTHQGARRTVPVCFGIPHIRAQVLNCKAKAVSNELHAALFGMPEWNKEDLEEGYVFSPSSHSAINLGHAVRWGGAFSTSATELGSEKTPGLARYVNRR